MEMNNNRDERGMRNEEGREEEQKSQHQTDKEGEAERFDGSEDEDYNI
ncbi:MAG TPA: hypothetical protein VEB60_02715 [Candidatus Paceibacterota bacterium]|nr:hypothetical protein [Candidatus Paceibacterota bacterium]